jgi:hypothetical protein
MEENEGYLPQGFLILRMKMDKNKCQKRMFLNLKGREEEDKYFYPFFVFLS